MKIEIKEIKKTLIFILQIYICMCLQWYAYVRKNKKQLIA